MKKHWPAFLVVMMTIGIAIGIMANLAGAVAGWNEFLAWWCGGRPVSAGSLNSLLLFALVVAAIVALVLFAQRNIDKGDFRKTTPLSQVDGIAREVDQGGAISPPITGTASDTGTLPDLAVAGQTWWKEKYYGTFIGHREELLQLLETLSPASTTSVLAIQAMGGMGKTAFCRELVGMAYDRHMFSTIAWVRARRRQLGESGEPGKMRESELELDEALQDIANEIRLPHWHALSVTQLKERLAQFFITQRCLIVIDGLEDAKSPKGLASGLSVMLGNSKAILNSRRSVEISAQHFGLQKLKPEESRDFILQVSRERFALDSQNRFLAASSSQIDEIIRITDGMPLALKLVISQAAYLPIGRIVEKLQDVNDTKGVYGYIFDESWRELKQARSHTAQRLLVYLAARELPVMVKFIYGLEGYADREIDDAFVRLRNLSLIEYSQTAESEQVGLHSLTKQYVNEVLVRS